MIMNWRKQRNRRQEQEVNPRLKEDLLLLNVDQFLPDADHRLLGIDGDRDLATDRQEESVIAQDYLHQEREGDRAHAMMIGDGRRRIAGEERKSEEGEIGWKWNVSEKENVKGKRRGKGKEKKREEIVTVKEEMEETGILETLETLETDMIVKEIVLTQTKRKWRLNFARRKKR